MVVLLVSAIRPLRGLTHNLDRLFGEALLRWRPHESMILLCLGQHLLLLLVITLRGLHPLVAELGASFLGQLSSIEVKLGLIGSPGSVGLLCRSRRDCLF